MRLYIPTINDGLADFDTLFGLLRQVNDYFLDVILDFTNCGFLRQNAVAFLGGMIRLVESRFGEVKIDMTTIQDAIQTNLAQNGFLANFGYSGGPWTGNSIPYRQDTSKEVDDLTEYLSSQWLGRGWVNISRPLRDSIVGRMWEIFENAFEHAYSEEKENIGIFCCGQHYPHLHTLKLTVIDYGVGIPSNVRLFRKNDLIASDVALRWAFQRGTTTKPNGMGRGLGLDMLKEFVRINQGQLEIFSHDAYGKIDQNEESYLQRSTFFEGTIVNITLRCDESYYRLASERTEQPLF